MPRGTLNIVVTGAGAPGIRGTLYALRNNPERRPVRIIGVDTDNDAVGRLLVESFYGVPAPEEPTYLDELRKICRRESVDIVVPQTTREIVMLSRWKHILNGEGIPVMVSDQCAIETANNKCALMHKFRELTLPFPDFRVARCEEELVTSLREFGYPHTPVVVKPPVSNGMRGVRVLRAESWDVRRFLREKPSGLEITLEELLRILRRGPGWPELLVTEYLPGPEYTVDAFRGEKVEIALPRLREQIRSGITFRSQSEDRDDMSNYSLHAARHIGLKYVFGFQFKLDGRGTAKILESNPRVQGTMVASVFSGANLIWLGVKEGLGETVSQIPTPVPARFYRFWGGVGVAGTRVDEI